PLQFPAGQAGGLACGEPLQVEPVQYPVDDAFVGRGLHAEPRHMRGAAERHQFCDGDALGHHRPLRHQRHAARHRAPPRPARVDARPGASSPASACRRVVLPAPLGPTTDTHAPRPIVSVTSATTVAPPRTTVSPAQATASGATRPRSPRPLTAGPLTVPLLMT